jgi:hypothetical protein
LCIFDAIVSGNNGEDDNVAEILFGKMWKGKKEKLSL